MPHKDWCGKPCMTCHSPCALDERIPCSPDCGNLDEDGDRDDIDCIKNLCDAYYDWDSLSEDARMLVANIAEYLYEESFVDREDEIAHLRRLLAGVVDIPVGVDRRE